MGRLHPNVLKDRKQRRMKRAYMKSYSAEVIKVPRSVGKSDVPDKMQGLFDYRGRGTTYWDTTLDRIFGFHKNNPLMFSQERLAAIKRLNEMTNEVSPECNVVISKGGITKTVIKFYFATDYSVCFFMKEDWLGMCVYKSMTYHGEGCRERAYFDLENKRISWVERIDLPTIVPDAPSG